MTRNKRTNVVLSREDATVLRRLAEMASTNRSEIVRWGVSILRLQHVLIEECDQNLVIRLRSYCQAVPSFHGDANPDHSSEKFNMVHSDRSHRQMTELVAAGRPVSNVIRAAIYVMEFLRVHREQGWSLDSVNIPGDALLGFMLPT